MEGVYICASVAKWLPVHENPYIARDIFIST
jgi:hypothetical protein